MEIKLGFIWDIKRFILHAPLGMSFYGMAIVVPSMALGAIMLFLFYELTEDKHIKDLAYVDIQGALGGIIVMFIAHVVYLTISWGWAV